MFIVVLCTLADPLIYPLVHYNVILLSFKLENYLPRYFFYFQDIEHLKPHIVHSLANAELYCMALANLYQDPNFHNLNHWGIIQALARKGIFVAEPSDCSLTETVLIQTTPLKMVNKLINPTVNVLYLTLYFQSAHMAVTEALMSLFLKETVPLDRVKSANSRMERWVGIPAASEDATSATEPEEALLSWIQTCCQVLKKKAERELKDDEVSNRDRKLRRRGVRFLG